MAPAQSTLSTVNASTDPVKDHFTFSIEEVTATERVPAHLDSRGQGQVFILRPFHFSKAPDLEIRTIIGLT